MIKPEITQIIEYDNNVVSLETESFKIINFYDKNGFEKYNKIMKSFLDHSGIYFLSQINQSLEREIYIGQTSNGFLNRIKDPNHKWNIYNDFDVIIWITKSNTINPWIKNELDYMEQYFINLFQNINQIKVLNNTNGNKNNGISLNSEKENLINYQLKTIKKKLMLVADKLFYETSNIEQIKNFNIILIKKTIDDTLLEIYKDDVEAIFNKETNAVMLKKGTIINTKKLSDKLIKEINIDEANKLKNDTWFSSPSTASIAISGNSTNGWTYWKQKSNKKLLTEIREK